jgi:hypothetical protein
MVLLATKGLFVLAAGAFVLSALMVKAARIPRHLTTRQGGVWEKLFRGPRLFVAVPVFRRLGLGSVLGYLAAGLAMGPWGLNVVSDPETMLHVAELGVVLFSAGKLLLLAAYE